MVLIFMFKVIITWIIIATYSWGTSIEGLDTIQATIALVAGRELDFPGDQCPWRI